MSNTRVYTESVVTLNNQEALARIDREIAESERKIQELKPRRDQLASISAELKKDSPLDVDGAVTQSQPGSVRVVP